MKNSKEQGDEKAKINSRQLQGWCHCHRLDLHLGVWDVCGCMYQHLSEKGAIVNRLDLKFESTSDCKDTTATTPATRTKIAITID
jgi:hypothetical protein